MIAKEARQALALQRFAEANPQLLEEIRELDAREQAQQIEWAFEDAAQERGVEPWEYALQLIAESPEQLQAMRLETHREVAEALGMTWEEYCQFNDLDPQ
ncbi:DUF6388 family protein [Pseudomonas mosselii]|uniref:DUF6388 family protein n=1 Tax=Pseudomonas mosselii TaxID=78327 RepID=UPI000D9833B9|nr:DUF6388 family protein [Pseudomonas mosselii]PYC20105.1 hypothetical protein DMX06_14605 [Pseudomonas mosselii]